MSNKILWIKVWGIAAVQGSITLTWVIYNLYFPLLLVEFGFSKELAIAILIIENALESIIEPIFGGLSDRQKQFFGSKVPLISFGIIASSVLFIVFPCLIIFGSEQPLAKFLLPTIAIMWAGAMAIFRAPTISLLGQCAKTNTLPQAASILTFVGVIIGAFRFDAYGLILSLGAGFAFTLGSFSLLIAAFVLRKLNFDNLPNNQQSNGAKISLVLLSLIFTIGIWMSWTLRLIMPAVSEILKLQFGADNGKIAMTIFLILLGLAAFPAGKIATTLNNNKAMQLGVIGTVMVLTVLSLFPNYVLPVAFLIVCFSLLLNGITPLILSLVPLEKSGLGLGFYFGGFGAGMSAYDFVFARFEIVDLEAKIFSAMILLCLIYGWLIIFKKGFDSSYF